MMSQSDLVKNIKEKTVMRAIIDLKKEVAELKNEVAYLRIRAKTNDRGLEFMWGKIEKIQLTIEGIK